MCISELSPGAGRRELIGALQSERQAGDFRIGHWLSPASAPRIEPHGHDTAHVVIVTAGSFQSEAAGDDRGPTIVFNPAGTWHADHFEGQGAFVGITLGAPTSRRVHQLALPTHPVRLRGPLAWGIACRLMRTAAASSDQFDEGTLDALCFELIGEAEAGASSERAMPPWLKIAAEYLREVEQNGAIQSIARNLGVHPVHLTRTFRRHFGCTPGEYVRAHRVSRAAGLLAKRRMSVAEVAADCNFADQSHLVRSFRRHFGMSPQRFRTELA